MNAKDIVLLRKLLSSKGREDLASLLEGGVGELSQSSQYGSYWNSIISSYNIYLELDKYLKAKKISQEDKQVILDSLLDIYPHKESEPEIVSVDFLILREYPVELEEEERVKKEIDEIVEFEHKIDVKYEFLLEQIKKAKEKYGIGDFDGALTNVRTSIEAMTFDIYKRITGEEIVGSGSLQEDYKKVKTLLSLAPESKTNNATKKMVQSLISVIDAIDEISNIMGDRHLRKVTPTPHHTALSISSANTVLNFLYSSLKYQYREKDNIYSELIKIIGTNNNRMLPIEDLMKDKEIQFILQRCDVFTKNILKNKLITEFEINHFRDSDIFFQILELFSDTLKKEDMRSIINKHEGNNQACGLKAFKEKHQDLVDEETEDENLVGLTIEEAEELGLI